MAPKRARSVKEAISSASSPRGEEGKEVAEKEQSQEGKGEEKTSVIEKKEAAEDSGEEEEEDDEESQQSKVKVVGDKANVKDAIESEDSEEEEEEDSEEEEEEDEEEKNEKDDDDGSSTEKANVKSILPLNAVPAEHRRGLVSEEGGEDSGNDPYSFSSFSPKKSIPCKPVDRIPKSKKPAKAPAKGTATKRVYTEDGNKDSKKRKMAMEEREETRHNSEPEKAKKLGKDQQRPLFQRVWDDNDEIILLKGMFNFCSENEISHSIDMDIDIVALHSFVKESINFDVSKSQLSDKIRRLRRKYLNNISRGKGGKDPYFSKPHDEMVFKLSKRIWRFESKDVLGNVGDKRRLTNRNVSSRDTFDWTLYPLLKKSLEMGGNQMPMIPMWEGPVVNELLSSVQSSKLEELEEKWRRLSKEEIALCSKRLSLMSEQMKLFSTFVEFCSR